MYVRVWMYVSVPVCFMCVVCVFSVCFLCVFCVFYVRFMCVLCSENVPVCFVFVRVRCVY